MRLAKQLYARVAELADAQDLKSCCGDTVPVRFRSRALKRKRVIVSFFLLWETRKMHFPQIVLYELLFLFLFLFLYLLCVFVFFHCFFPFHTRSSRCSCNKLRAQQSHADGDMVNKIVQCSISAFAKLGSFLTDGSQWRL